MKSIIFSTIFFFFFSGVLMAQVTISGVVVDEKQAPIPGVNVYLKDTYDGATTGDNGKFSFTTEEKGKFILVASFIGYNNIEKELEISGDITDLKLQLVEAVSELSLVTITAGSFEASDERKSTVLKPLDIVTTAGAQGDTYSALKTLPGAQQVGEQDGLFVRGGTGAETQTFIDGMLVDKPFFSTAPDLSSRGRFSPFLFKGTIFSSGAYSSQYGQGLSGAVILESMDMPERSSGTLGISPLGINGGIFKLLNNQKTSVGAEVNYTNLSPYFSLIKQKQEIIETPSFIGGSTFFRQKSGKTGIIKFYGYYNGGQFTYAFPNLEDAENDQLFGIKNDNIYTNLSYKSALNDKWSMQAGFSYSTNSDKIKYGLVNNGTIIDSSIFNIKNTSDLTQGRLVFSRAFGTYSTIRVGTEVHNRNSNFHIFNQKYSYSDLYSALFTEADVYFTTRFAGRIGVRAEHSSLVDAYNIAPRVSLSYKLSAKTQVSLAAGQFFQEPPYENSYLLKDKGYSNATHYIANVQSVSSDYTFRTEIFYKQYNNLIKTYPDIGLNGTGYAKGIELFWRDKRTLKFVDYWISYSYLDTKRNWLDFPISAQPSFAADHTANLVFKKWFDKIKTNLSATYTFATGRPYYNPNRPDSEYLSDLTPDYHTLGISASYLTTIGKAFTVIVASVTNVLGTKQVYGYRYSSDGTFRSEINPPAPRFFFVGMFMSWGIDRRQETIDNN